MAYMYALENLEYIKTFQGPLVMWLLAAFHGKVLYTLSGLKNSYARNNVIAGSIVGPTLGVWLSMVSVQLIAVGIASTIMATRPIMMLPLSKWIYKENISYRAIVGTILALIGVTIIFILG